MPEQSDSRSSESCSTPTRSPESHEPPVSPQVSQLSAPMTHGRPRLKKLLIPLVLFALGVLLAVLGYFVVYPTPETGIPSPSYSHITIATSVPIRSVAVRIGKVDEATGSVSNFSVWVFLPDDASIPPVKSKEALTVQLPTGADFHDCASCVNDFWPFPIESFATEKLVFQKWYSLLVAKVSFKVTPSDFGVSFYDIDAYAAIPEITLKGPRLGQFPQVTTIFSIPSASSYDWSSFRPQAAGNSTVTRTGILPISNATTGRTTVGIDHAREANDSTLAFFAGALIGLAGAAILSAAQEALHIFTDPAPVPVRRSNSE